MTRNQAIGAAVVTSLLLASIWVSKSNAQEGQTGIPPEVVQEFREFARMKAQQAQTLGNMRTIQIAVESYATDSGGTYPTNISEAAPYLPGGSNKIGGTAGSWPPNAFGGADTPPYNAKIVSLAQVQKMRKMPPQITPGKPGEVGYSVFNNNLNYAIIGTDGNGNALPNSNDPNKGMTIVLSND
jgi:hypothetical protein